MLDYLSQKPRHKSLNTYKSLAKSRVMKSNLSSGGANTRRRGVAASASSARIFNSGRVPKATPILQLQRLKNCGWKK